jgi:hypothetical protein
MRCQLPDKLLLRSVNHKELRHGFAARNVSIWSVHASDLASISLNSIPWLEPNNESVMGKHSRST